MNTVVKQLRLPLVALFLYFTLHSYTICVAQQTESTNPFKGLPFKDRIFFGGDFALGFGDFTFIRIAPILGYNVNSKFQIGGGPSYQYMKWKTYTPTQVFTNETSIYGGSLFGRYFIFDSFYLQSSLEILNLKAINPSINDEGVFYWPRTTIPVWFVGGGFVQRSGRGGFMIGAFYDLIQDPNSPYGNGLFISVGGFF
jgi:hypothetical protein